MAIQDRITQIALSKQTAQLSEAASGTYRIGVNSGNVATFDLTEEDLPTSWSSRLLEQHDRVSFTPGMSFETLAMPKSIGLILAAVLGTETIAGSGPYVHTFKAGITLPYLTGFARKDNEYWKIGDQRVSEVEISWDTTKAAVVKVTTIGCTYTFLAAPFSANNDERPQSGVLKGAGGIFQIDGANAIVKSGSIKITNNVDPIFGAASPLPVDVFPAMQTVDVSLVVVPNDVTLFRKVVTGSTSGTAVQNTPQYGSVQCKFVTDANTDLTFIGSRVRFLTSFPDTSAEGGPVEVTLEGSIANDATGADPFTFALRNTIAATY